METIKAISLVQPYATLIAIGAKRIETRSWSTRYRGMLAIHASKAIPRWAREEVRDDHHFGDALRQAGLSGGTSDLPTGAIVAVAELVAVVPITRKWGLVDPRVFEWTDTCGRELRFEVTHQECTFGAYSDGRFAWLLADVVTFDPVLNVRGQLGLWDVDTQRLPPLALAGCYQGLAL